MKIFKNKEYVKLIPKRYDPIKDCVLDICDTEKKRLSPGERKMLELELLRYDLKMSNKLVFGLIKGREYKSVTKVLRRDSPDEYRVLFGGAPEIRVSSKIALILNGGYFKRTKRVL